MYVYEHKDPCVWLKELCINAEGTLRASPGSLYRTSKTSVCTVQVAQGLLSMTHKDLFVWFRTSAYELRDLSKLKDLCVRVAQGLLSRNQGPLCVVQGPLCVVKYLRVWLKDLFVCCVGTSMYELKDLCVWLQDLCIWTQGPLCVSWKESCMPPTTSVFELREHCRKSRTFLYGLLKDFWVWTQGPLCVAQRPLCVAQVPSSMNSRTSVWGLSKDLCRNLRTSGKELKDLC